jgi:hypothetical protein
MPRGVVSMPRNTLGRHWWIRNTLQTETPNGARRAMLLIGGIIVDGLLAMHFLAPAPGIETADVPTAETR